MTSVCERQHEPESPRTEPLLLTAVDDTPADAEDWSSARPAKAFIYVMGGACGSQENVTIARTRMASLAALIIRLKRAISETSRKL